MQNKLTSTVAQPSHGAAITRKQAEQKHRELVARSQVRLQEFIRILSHLPYAEGKKALTADITFLIEQHCGFDLPDNFSQEVGRQINKAIREGHLPFVWGLFGRGSHAGYKGIDLDLLEEALAASKKPTA